MLTPKDNQDKMGPVQNNPQNAMGGQMQALKVLPKLEVNQPGDEFEREADQVAHDIVHRKESGGGEGKPIDNPGAEGPGYRQMPNGQYLGTGKRTLQSGKRTLLSRKSKSPGGMEVSSGFASQLSSTKGSGKPLTGAVKTEMENGLGADLSSVRLHNNSQAANLSQQISAKAFTHGQDVYFNQGQMDLISSGGKELLAHELVHTQQEGGSGVKRYEGEGPRVHVVQPGETPSGIANKYGITLNQLATYNHGRGIFKNFNPGSPDPNYWQNSNMHNFMLHTGDRLYVSPPDGKVDYKSSSKSATTNSQTPAPIYKTKPQATKSPGNQSCGHVVNSGPAPAGCYTKLTGSSFLLILILESAGTLDVEEMNNTSYDWDYVAAPNINKAADVLKAHYQNNVGFIQGLVIKSHGAVGAGPDLDNIDRQGVVHDPASSKGMVGIKPFLTNTANIVLTACSIVQGYNDPKHPHHSGSVSTANNYAKFFLKETQRNLFMNWTQTNSITYQNLDNSYEMNEKKEKESTLTAGDTYTFKFDQDLFQKTSGGFMWFYYGKSGKLYCQKNYKQVYIDTGSGWFDDPEVFITDLKLISEGDSAPNPEEPVY